MRYAVLDVEKPPSAELLEYYDIVISTNCIHATKDLSRSAIHIREMLKPNSILCLVELTRNLF
jgi:2-polyprenyl-3-methyl-5-hydroxy-6-metoxy-1,4-benzoquinol methylase